VVAQSREEHEHLLVGGVLCFIENHKGVVECPAAHVGERGDFDGLAFHVFLHFLHGHHIGERIVQRTQIGAEFFSIPEGEDIFDVTLERAFEIAAAERERKAQSVIQDLGDFQVLNGRYGPYIKKGGQNFNIPKGLDPATLDRETLEKFMTEGGNGRRRQHVIQDFDGIQIIAGRYGPYIKHDGNNYKIPPDVEASKLDKAACAKIMKENPATNKKK